MIDRIWYIYILFVANQLKICQFRFWLFCTKLDNFNKNTNLLFISVAFKMLLMEKPDQESFVKLTSNVDHDLIKLLYPGILTVIQKAVRLPPKKLKKLDFANDLKEIKYVLLPVYLIYFLNQNILINIDSL